MTARIRMRVLLTLALTALLAGTVVVVIETTTPSASFGWFAYAPLSATTFSPANDVHVVTTPMLVGAGLLGAGLVALAFWAGHAVARRSGR